MAPDKPTIDRSILQVRGLHLGFCLGLIAALVTLVFVSVLKPWEKGRSSVES